MPLFKTKEKTVLGSIKCKEFEPSDFAVFSEYYKERPIESFNCDSMFQFYLSKRNEGWKPKSWIKSVWFEYDGYLCVADICKNSTYLSDYPFNKEGKPMSLNSLQKLFDAMGCDAIKVINVPPFVVDAIGRDNIKSDGFKVLVNSSFGLDHIDDNLVIKENKGKHLANLRHTAKRFERLCPNLTVLAFDGSDEAYDVFSEIYDYWASHEGSKYDIFDKDFYFTLLDNWSDVGYHAFAFRNDDNMEWIGMTSYFILNDKIAYCFARKFKNEYIGSADYSQIYISTKMLEDGISYCHNGSDGGEGPLRFFKDKMHSVYLNKSYILKKV